MATARTFPSRPLRLKTTIIAVPLLRLASSGQFGQVIQRPFRHPRCPGADRIERRTEHSAGFRHPHPAPRRFAGFSTRIMGN